MVIGGMTRLNLITWPYDILPYRTDVLYFPATLLHLLLAHVFWSINRRNAKLCIALSILYG